MTKDPTIEQMRSFAEKHNITSYEAWHRFRGELTLGRFALRAIAFGYTPDSFKAEFNEIDIPLGTAPVQVEETKRAKSSVMSRTVRK